jgi:hypothetical protein
MPGKRSNRASRKETSEEAEDDGDKKSGKARRPAWKMMLAMVLLSWDEIRLAYRSS